MFTSKEWIRVNQRPAIELFTAFVFPFASQWLHLQDLQ